MNNHAESKTTGEQVIKDSHVKNRSNDQRKSKKSVVAA